MYLTLRRYAGAASRIEQVSLKVKAGLVPILKRVPGFQSYCTLATEAGDGVSLSLFETEQAASQANEQARSWVMSNLSDLLPDPPEVFAGPVVMHAGAQGQQVRFGNPEEPLYVLIRKFENIIEPQKAEQFTRDISIPAHRDVPGFRGFYAAWGDPGRSRAAIVTLFDTQENASLANERVLALIQAKGGTVVPQPSQIVAGSAVVIASS
jgi:hypothetical protein